MNKKTIASRSLARRVLPAVAVVLATLVADGCTRKTGVTRRGIQGAITFAGKPVPAGGIMFEPDTSRGGFGPGAMADIKDGRYSIPSRRGVVTGPHRVRVFAYSRGESASEATDNGPPSKMLRPEHVELVDIDPKTSVLDIDLPEPPRKGR